MESELARRSRFVNKGLSARANSCVTAAIKHPQVFAHYCPCHARTPRLCWLMYVTASIGAPFATLGFGFYTAVPGPW